MMETRQLPDRSQWHDLIAGEYREMPGLSLTLHQAARLWGIDPMTTRLLLDELLERRVLRQTADGVYRLQ